MADLDLAKALSSSQALMTQIVVIFLIATFLIWALGRYLQFLLIEKGGREKIINKINESKLIKNLLYIINPDIKFPIGKTDQIKNLLEAGFPEITYDSDNSWSSIKYLKEEIIFKKRRGLLLLFFYNNQSGKQTFNNFNGWLGNRDNRSKKISSGVFRREIEKINGILKKNQNIFRKLLNV